MVIQVLETEEQLQELQEIQKIDRAQKSDKSAILHESNFDRKPYHRNCKSIYYSSRTSDLRHHCWGITII